VLSYQTVRFNPLNHPVYELLPSRTHKKLQSPVSEDKLTWDCFFGLKRADALGSVLADALNIPREELVGPHLILWGWEIHESSASKWSPLSGVLSALENYADGKPEGQKTEPDAIVFTERSIVIIECKRKSSLGRCSRFGKSECPESHISTRKRPYCQYWARGLDQLVTFPKPTPMELIAECDSYYQLMRNYMVGLRLSELLRLDLHLLVVKARNLPDYRKTEAEVKDFNSRTKVAPKYSLVCWNDLRFARGVDMLAAYASELYCVDPKSH